MISTVEKTAERMKLFLFDTKTKLCLAKNDIPIEGGLIRKPLLPAGGCNGNA